MLLVVFLVLLHNAFEGVVAEALSEDVVHERPLTNDAATAHAVNGYVDDDPGKEQPFHAEDYYEIRHDDGIFVGMRAVPLTKGLRQEDGSMTQDDAVDASAGTAVVETGSGHVKLHVVHDAAQQDDDDDFYDSGVIHVVRRRPSHLLEVEPDSDVEAVELHDHHGRKVPQILKTFPESEHHHHEDNHVIFDEVGNDVNRHDVARVKAVLKDRRQREKDIDKRMRKYERRLTSKTRKEERRSDKAAKQLDKLLKKEEATDEKKRMNREKEEEKRQMAEEKAEEIEARKLTNEDVKQIVHSLHDDDDHHPESHLINHEGNFFDSLASHEADKGHNFYGYTKRKLDQETKHEKNDAKIVKAALTGGFKKRRSGSGVDVLAEIEDALDHHKDLHRPAGVDDLLEHHADQNFHFNNEEVLRELMGEFEDWRNLKGMKESTKRQALDELLKEYRKWRGPSSKGKSNEKIIHELMREYALWKNLHDGHQ